MWSLFFFAAALTYAGTVSQPGPRTLDYAGLALWGVGVGFGFESVADLQLARFKAVSANRDRVMDRGLWRYTRHPNYFGDCCVWWAF